MDQSKSFLLNKRRTPNDAHSGSLTYVVGVSGMRGVYIIYDVLIGEPNEFQQGLLSDHKDISHIE